ncbi:hypothetical protein [Aureimonas ureilytica]|uniref:hypothetical protein n=1 Tax=Aureimonas ureilytica TaxID=401562 RepID=UPI000AFBDA8E|nr:hypothetical protein [Aureimonas ureilytica]
MRTVAGTPPVIANGWDLAFAFPLEAVNKSLSEFVRQNPKEGIAHKDPEAGITLDLVFGHWRVCGGSRRIVDISVLVAEGFIEFENAILPHAACFYDLAGLRIELSTSLNICSTGPDSAPAKLGLDLGVACEAADGCHILKVSIDETSCPSMPMHIRALIAEIIRQNIDKSSVAREFSWITLGVQDKWADIIPYTVSYAISNATDCVPSLVVAFRIGTVAEEHIELDGLPSVGPDLYGAAISQRFFMELMVKPALLDAIVSIDPNLGQRYTHNINPQIFLPDSKQGMCDRSIFELDLVSADRATLHLTSKVEIRMWDDGSAYPCALCELTCDQVGESLIIVLRASRDIESPFLNVTLHDALRMNLSISPLMDQSSDYDLTSLSFVVTGVDYIDEAQSVVDSVIQSISRSALEKFIEVLASALSTVRIPFDARLSGQRKTRPINVYMNGGVAINGLIL